MDEQKILEGIESGKLIVLPKWVRTMLYANPIGLIIFFVWVGVKSENIESRLFDSVEQKSDVQHHLDDVGIHMEYEKKIDVFVPRKEIEYKLEVLEKNQEKILEKLNIN